MAASRAIAGPRRNAVGNAPLTSCSDDLTAVAVDRDLDDGWVVLRRGEVSVAANLSTTPVTVDLGRPVAPVLAHFGDVEQGARGAHTLGLGGHAVAVVRSA